MKEFIYYSTENFQNDDRFVVKIPPGIKNEHDLMHAYYDGIVPPYFGFNWDALWDILRDMEWINKKHVIILHSELPHLHVNEKKIYLKLLYDAINDWKKNDVYELDVAFPISEKITIENILS